MVRGFKILEHPADLGIEAWGSTLPEAFEQAASCLMSIILDTDAVVTRTHREITLDATDYEHLLVKWLGEILYLYDGRNFVGKEFLINSLTSTRLEATVRGEQLDLTKHTPRLDVKAVTYHQIIARDDRDRAFVRVFLDI